MKFRGIVLFLIVLILQSCSFMNYQAAYDAPPPMIPLHQEKGEIKLSGGYGHFLGFNGQASFAAGKHLAFFGNGSFNHQTIKTYGMFNPIYFNNRNHSFDGGLGYFVTLKGKKPTVIEAYFGVGKGLSDKRYNFNKNFEFGYDLTKGRYTKYFGQINFGIIENKKIGIALSNRLSFLHFNELAFKYNVNPMGTDPENTDVFYNKNLVFTEPSIKITYGQNKLKFMVQGGIAYPLNNSQLTNEAGDNFGKGSFIFNAGLELNLYKKPK